MTPMCMTPSCESLQRRFQMAQCFRQAPIALYRMTACRRQPLNCLSDPFFWHLPTDPIWQASWSLLGSRCWRIVICTGRSCSRQAARSSKTSVLDALLQHAVDNAGSMLAASLPAVACAPTFAVAIACCIACRCCGEASQLEAPCFVLPWSR